MTSEQVMLTVTALLLCSCAHDDGPVQQMPALPGQQQHVWAVAPIRNESGSLDADGLALADHVARQLETVPGLDVLPVNRTLAAMESLGLDAPASRTEAMELIATLNADALVAGTITAYDPYDPPKLGLTLELYVSRQKLGGEVVDLRKLVSAAVETGEQPDRVSSRQPVCVASAVFDASDPDVKRMLESYARDRGRSGDTASPRLHRISMDLFSKFVSHVMSLRLLEAETRRLNEIAQPHVPDR